MCADAALCVVIEALFADSVARHHNVRLVARGDEPLYMPAAAGRAARLGYVAGRPRSALHEIAHWCIAGDGRRQLPDFGYWYAPDGRDTRAQRNFERVEGRPQALEMLFCQALDIPFEVSIDNLGADLDSAVERAARRRFADTVRRTAAHAAGRRHPRAAFSFMAALQDWRRTPASAMRV